MIRGRHGFTIVEVVLFLAISAAMFSIGFVGLRGRQDSVAFRQAVDDIDIKIKEIFNNVDNGYFGNAGQYTCNPGVVDTDWVTASLGVDGGNSNCAYLGKMIEFKVADRKTMYISTILGNRMDLTVTTSNVASLQEKYTLPYAVQYSGASGIKIAAVRDNDSDLRSHRYTVSTLWWSSIGASLLPSDENTAPKLCFDLGGQKAYIKITQKDTVVDYNGGGC